MDPITLAALAVKAAPTIARWLGFGETAKDIAGIASTIFGSTDAKAIDEKIAAQPELYVQFQIRLAEIAAQRERDERQAELETFKTEIGDRINARARDTALVTSGHTNVRANVILAGAYFTMLACIVAITMSALKNWALTGEVIALFATIITGCIAILKDSSSFEYGTSRSSQAKDATIAALIQNGHK